MVFQCINIRQVPWEVLKTSAFGLGFQHLPRDLANINAWKIMFDPYIGRHAESDKNEATKHLTLRAVHDLVSRNAIKKKDVLLWFCFSEFFSFPFRLALWQR